MTNWKEFVSMTAPMVNTLCMLAANLPCHYIIDQVRRNLSFSLSLLPILIGSSEGDWFARSML